MEPQPALKLCRDCKHFSEYGDDDGGRCIRPVPRLEPDYVNGFLERELDYDAQSERKGSARGACGPSGQFWVKA